MSAVASAAQRYAVRAGSPRTWLGTREVGVMGSTMVALERKGLAVVKPAREVPALRDRSLRFVYQLTPAGNALRVGWAIDEAAKPVEHVPVPVRCTHCGAEYPDGTPGGSCSCGLPVEAVAA